LRFVGDPVACVIAETVDQAKNAAEAVALDVEPLPVLNPAEAVKPGAPLVFDGCRTTSRRLPPRRCCQGRGGLRQGQARHEAQDLEPAHDRAPMEPRAAIGEYQAASGAGR
jgi:carbon-monoxide dehydrogenase large subunit